MLPGEVELIGGPVDGEIVTTNTSLVTCTMQKRKYDYFMANYKTPSGHQGYFYGKYHWS